MEYTTHKYGCRTIQTAFLIFREEYRMEMLKELQNIVPLCYHFNGNHVVQKIFISMGKQMSINYLINQVISDLSGICVNEHGCRVIQRMLEHCSPILIEPLVHIAQGMFEMLIENQYGTFVLCSVVEHGAHHHRQSILSKVKLQMCLDSNGSKLIENLIKNIGTWNPSLEES